MMVAGRRAVTREPSQASWLPYPVAIAVGELAIGAGWVALGVAVLLLTMGMLVLHAGVWATQPGIGRFIARVFALSLALVPLLRVVSLVMPLAPIPYPFWPLLTWLPIAAGIVALLHRATLAPTLMNIVGEKLGLHLAFALVGLPVGVVVFALLRPQPLAAHFGPGSLLLAVFGLLIVGACEEMLFRGLLLEGAVAALGERGGVLYVSGLYAALQCGTLSPITVLIAFVAALAAAWWVRRTRSIVGVAVAHGLANILAYLVLPIFTQFGAPENGSGGALNAATTAPSVTVVLTPALRVAAQGVLVAALIALMIAWLIARGVAGRGQTIARDLPVLLIPCGIAGSVVLITRLWLLALGE